MKAFKISLFAIFALISFTLTANELRVCTPTGEQLLFDMQPEDSFINVVESISGCFESNYESILTENEKPLPDSSSKHFSMDIFVSGSKISKVVAKQPKNVPRNYWAPLSDEDKGHVTYILKTLATHSAVTLIAYQADLKARGEKVDHIHPFMWLLFGLSNPEINGYIHVIFEGKGLQWKGYLNGTVTTLEQEASIGNLKKEYLQDFALRLGIDPEVLAPYLKDRRWKDFVKEVIQRAPKVGGSGRYQQ